MDEKKSYQLLQFAEDHDGYVSVSEAKRFGIAQTYLVMAEEEGQFSKVAKGLYVKRGYPLDKYYIMHYRYQKLVFHLRSAAFLHHWIEEDDDALSIKCPRNYMTSGIEGTHCKHVNSQDYQLGIGIVLTHSGQFVPATDKERTFIDLLNHQDVFDKSLLKSILENALRDNLEWDRLLSYADYLGQKQTIEALRLLYE